MSASPTGVGVQAAADRLCERRRQRHIEIARQKRREAEATLGVPPAATVVTGRTGASETSVKPGGDIRYVFKSKL